MGSKTITRTPSETLRRAAELLEVNAEALKVGATINGEWREAIAEKMEYEETLGIIDELRAMADAGVLPASLF